MHRLRRVLQWLSQGRYPHGAGPGGLSVPAGDRWLCPVRPLHAYLPGAEAAGARRTEPAAFIVWNGDEAARRNSTAGGAFSALAEYVLEGGGVVFGAALDNDLRVSHIAVKNRHDLPQLRGSKPVQSDVGESYQQVRLYLDQGRQVLFSGTALPGGRPVPLSGRAPGTAHHL